VEDGGTGRKHRKKKEVQARGNTTKRKTQTFKKETTKRGRIKKTKKGNREKIEDTVSNKENGDPKKAL